jgi:MarR family transcriptional regulator, negative regulator of the multidrug operon emrRAB
MKTANMLGAVALALVDHIDSSLAEDDLGRTEAAALIHIGDRPGETVQFLARVLGLTHSGAVRLVDRLADAGLVERRRAADARAVALQLTRRGAIAVDKALAAREKVLGDAISALDPVESKSFAAVLERVLSQLTTDRWRARHICRLCDYAGCSIGGCPVDIAAAHIEFAGKPSS